MSCPTCGNNVNPHSVYAVQYQYNTNCDSCTSADCPNGTYTAKCLFYTAANLPCSGILTNDSLEVALQKIESKLCETVGDYSTYSYNCVATAGSVTTEAQFVNLITAYACNLNTSLTTFTGTTFPAYQATVAARFVALEVPGITCATAGVVNTDTLQQVLTKYCTKLTSLTASLSLVGINWNQCFTVVTPPTTISGAISLLLDQICQVKASSGSLPVFDNTGTCLDSPGAADSLASTISKITTRLCLTPTLDINALTWGCVTKPSVTATDLQGSLDAILAKLQYLSENLPSFDPSDFAIANVDDDNLCLGKNIGLATPLNQDRFVAVNVADSSPGTLIQKLIGVGVTIDDTTNPGKITITGGGGGSDNFTVKASSTDSTPNYLDGKFAAGTTGAFTVTPSYDAGLEKIKLVPSYNLDELFTELLDYVESNSAAKARLCEIMASCPSPCQSPSNVQAIIV